MRSSLNTAPIRYVARLLAGIAPLLPIIGHTTQSTDQANVELASINYSGKASGNHVSSLVAVNTDDGRFILFGSMASDLTSLPDTNAVGDLFLRDRQTGVTHLVSVNSAGTAAASTSGTIDEASVTPDGRFVVFTSTRYDLAANDTDGWRDVFVRDVQMGTTRLVNAAAPGNAILPRISSNGRFVAFLVRNDIWRQDLQTGQNTLVAHGDFNDLAMTPDGRFVLFQEFTNGQSAGQLFLRDLQTQTTTRVTVNHFGTGAAAGYFYHIRISGDGRFITFDANYTDLVDDSTDRVFRDVFVRDMQLGVTRRISPKTNIDCELPDISANGRVISYFYGFSERQVHVYDQETDITEQITTHYTRTFEMSPNGRFIVFQSDDGSLVDKDTNGKYDIFLFDRELKTLLLISHQSGAADSANGHSTLPITDVCPPVVSDDGQIAFDSQATNLVTTPKSPAPPGYSPTTDVYTVKVGPGARALNVSTRLRVETGDGVGIGGFILTGNQLKQVVLRAIGPSLSAAGIPGVLQNPVLELHNSSGTLLVSNDNWKDTQQSEIEATGLQPGNDLEPAILRTLAPGSYTAIVLGKNQTTGVALVEAYDADGSASSKLANISTRGVVGTGDNVMIAGFIVGEGFATNILVRGIGPSLASDGINGVLEDPVLALHDQNGAVIASDDNWKDSQQTEIQSTGLAPSDDREAAILATVTQGNYTAILYGKSNGVGVGLVEVFSIQ